MGRQNSGVTDLVNTRGPRVFTCLVFPTSTFSTISFSEMLSFQLNVMGSRSQNTATHREGSSAMGKVPHGDTLEGRDSFPSGINTASAKPSDAIISNALSHADHPDARSSLSCRQVCPVIYTKHHFEHLKFGALQYTKDMLQRHEERQIIITRRGIARHWRKQVKREYSESHPMWTYLRKQVGLLFSCDSTCMTLIRRAADGQWFKTLLESTWRSPRQGCPRYMLRS